MEVSEPKWVNSILDIIGVEPLRLGGLHIQIENKNTYSVAYVKRLFKACVIYSLNNLIQITHCKYFNRKQI